MREVENLPFGPTARWTSLNLVGSFDRPPGCRTWLGAPVACGKRGASGQFHILTGVVPKEGGACESL